MANKQVELRGTITPEGHYDVTAWVDGKEATEPDLVVRGVDANGVVEFYERLKRTYGQAPVVSPGDVYDCFPAGFFEK